MTQAILFFSRAIRSEAQHKKLGHISAKLNHTLIQKYSNQILIELGKIGFDKFWFSDQPVSERILNKFGFNRNFIQDGATLSERLFNAYQTLKRLGYCDILIVGNDTTISASELIDVMQSTEDVIGRSFDHGFYLLKLSDFNKQSHILNSEYWNNGSLATQSFEFKELSVKHDYDYLWVILSCLKDRLFIFYIVAELKVIVGSKLKLHKSSLNVFHFILNKAPPFFA